MRRNRAQSGGVFLTIGILGGFALGVTLGEPLRFALLGTAAGVCVAIALWLLDRRRS